MAGGSIDPGSDHVYVLSGGWGLIPATFLTPDYDINANEAELVAGSLITLQPNRLRLRRLSIARQG